MAYSIDSSGVLDLFRYYPPDVFPSIWAQVETATKGGLILAIDEVYRELEKKDDDAFQWMKSHREMIIAIDTEVQKRVTKILAIHHRLIDTRKNRSAGDPFVIALAQLRNCPVVTGEKATGNIAKPNIPDVCAALGVACMPILAMFRKEGWRV